MGLIDGLIRSARAQESADTYHLDRAELKSVDEGYRWLTDYCDDDGQNVWSGTSWRSRRQLVRRMFWLRWAYRQEFLARGGRP